MVKASDNDLDRIVNGPSGPSHTRIVIAAITGLAGLVAPLLGADLFDVDLSGTQFIVLVAIGGLFGFATYCVVSTFPKR